MAEIRKLLWQVLWAVPPRIAAVLGWSVWRRRHQALAQTCHYRLRTLRHAQHLQL